MPVYTSTASTVYQLTNATGGTITVNGSSVTGDFAITGEVTGGADCSSGNSLAAHASCFVAIRFTPLATGTRSGSLTVTTSIGTASAALNGTGANDPGIAFTPGELLFDNVPSAAATTQSITILNTSAYPTTVASATSSDPHFAVTSNCATLAAGASCTMTVTYTPGDGLSSGTLTIPITTAPAGASVSTTYGIALSGRFPAESAGIQIIPGEHESVNFGSAATGTTTSTRVLHVNNLTSTALTLAVSAPRQFALTGTSCGVLAASASCDLTVQYTPVTGGNATGTVFLQGTPSDGSAPRNGLAYLEGYGSGKASLTITGNLSLADVVNFGSVSSGQGFSQTLTLTNPLTSAPGTAITVRRVQSEFPFLSTTDCGAPLAPGQSCSVAIRYTPLYQVSHAADVALPQIDPGTLSIESDAANAPVFVDLLGQASAAIVSLPSNTAPIAAFTTSQGSLTFGTSVAGTASAPQTVQLVNTGTATVHVTGTVTSSGFQAANGCGTLPAGARCSITVTYQPQTSGTALGSLQIQSDAITSLEFVSLLGTGSPASVTLAPLSLDYGRVLVGRTTSQVATLTNTGNTSLSIGAIATSGTDFAPATATTATDACPRTGGTVAAGASCSVAVLFTPSASGTFRGTLSVATSATPLPLTVALSGVGTRPQLSITPASLSFGNVVVGTTATQSVTLRNISTLTVDGLGFQVTPGFVVSSTCGITSLNAASSCAVSVTFAPTATGTYAGMLTIASTDPAAPITIPLSGTAIQPGTITQPTPGDIALTVNGGAAATVTVQTGLPAAYALNVTPTNGFTGVVTLTCMPETPADSTACSLLPSTMTLAGAAQTSAATIATLVAVTASAQKPLPLGIRGVLLCATPALLLLLGLRRRRFAAILALVLAVTLFSGGCGSSVSQRVRYAAAGTYTFHVTATPVNGVTAAQTVTLTLVIKPR